MLVDPLAGFRSSHFTRRWRKDGWSSTAPTTICACCTAAGSSWRRIFSIHDRRAPLRLPGTRAGRVGGQTFRSETVQGFPEGELGLAPSLNQMIEYAINDTKYLLPLAEILEAELLRLNRWEWFSESCDRMIASAGEPRGRDETKAGGFPEPRRSPRAPSRFCVFFGIWRDVEARSWDRPPFHVMSNEDIVRIAESAVEGKAFSTPRMSNRRRKSFEIILALAFAYS